MIALWMIFSVLGGILLSFSQAFQAGDFIIEPSWLSLIAASLGLGIWMKVSSMRSRASHRFFIGFVGAWVYFLISLYWIYIALREIGELPIWISIAGLIFLSALCAVFLALWSLFAGLDRIREKGIFLRIFLWSSLFALMGFLREHILWTGFSWAEPSVLFAYFPWMGRSAWFWGLHGLSFFWMFSLCLIMHSDECFRNRRHRIISASWLGFFFTVILLAQILPGQEQAPKVSISITSVQPNISQDMKWQPGEAQQNLTNLIQLTKDALKDSPDLIVWPETSFPYAVARNQVSFPMNSSVPLVIGAVMRDGRVNLNTAILIEDNQRKSYFAKVHLVPFGEYVPFEEYLPFEKLVENAGRFVPGAPDHALLEIKESQVRMGPLICYEDIFVRHSVRHAQRGANLLLNLTNDGWYRKSSALLQHAALAQMQVFSTGLPMLRSTNTGLTSYITFWSRQDYFMHQRGIFPVEAEIVLEPKKSFFVQFYDFLRWIWLGIFAIALLWTQVTTTNLATKKIFFRK